MILYLIKSTLCLGIILMVYHLFLEREKMHQFNRYFLLGGLVVSFVIPSITIGYYSDKVVESNVVYTFLNSSLGEQSVQPPATGATIDFELVALGIYLLISLGFLVRFLGAIFLLIKKIRSNPKVHYKNVQLVLVPSCELPHTFLKYIFINADAYHNREIEEELFTHELTHARQQHSLDILFLELCQVVLWFIPLLYFYKRAIQLNHEFLADENVIESHHPVADYQYLLLEKAGLNTKNYLASNLNYLVTKKRLKMMTKKTSRWKVYFYAASTIPFFICLLMLFGTKANGQSDKWDSASEKQMKDIYFKDASFVFIDEDGTQRVKLYYHDLTDQEKAAIPIPPPPPPVSSEEELQEKIQPLPKGTKVHVNKDGDIWIDGYGGNMPPPPPPVPVSPIEHLKSLLNSGATFMLDEKEITGEKAIELLSDDESKYNIESCTKDGKQIVTLKKQK